MWKKYLISASNYTERISTVKFNTDATKLVAGARFPTGSGDSAMLFIFDVASGALD